MLERGRGRIVHTGSGASYLPGSRATRVLRRARRRSAASARRSRASSTGTPDPRLRDQPGPRADGHDRGDFPDDAPWTPPRAARRASSARSPVGLDALAGRYLHAEHDDIDDLIARADAISRRRPERDPAAGARQHAARSRRRGRLTSRRPSAPSSAVPASWRRPSPPERPPDHDVLLAAARALGRCGPRAGRARACRGRRARPRTRPGSRAPPRRTPGARARPPPATRRPASRRWRPAAAVDPARRAARARRRACAPGPQTKHSGNGGRRRPSSAPRRRAPRRP